jgi:Na+/H+ antiporter
MHLVHAFEFVLFLLLAVMALEWLAHCLRLPPAAAQMVGGIALAFIPGTPALQLDHELVLLLFLPPLLMVSAYFTVLSDFRRNISAILSMAVGAVIFTTLVVGVVVHWMIPSLPWAACFALGAVVSPPDAVAAKAVLERVRLPRRLTALLEGESLLNDASGLVLFRFAVAAALTGTFSLGEAVVTFTTLSLGGAALGAALGYALVWLMPRLKQPHIIIAATFMLPWIAYVAAERLHLSGVIATVAAGLVFGWYQHEVFTASVRVRATATWEVVVFILESLVFVLIGLSLRGVVERLGGAGETVVQLGPPVLGVVLAVILSRFAYVFAVEGVRSARCRMSHHGDTRFSARACTVLSWAGMRGVVTLAVALSVPEEMAGRDLILASAFAVILVTVLLQGTTLGVLIRLLRLQSTPRQGAHLSRAEARARIAAVQAETVRKLAYDGEGNLIHPRLLDQFSYRARAADRFSRDPGSLMTERDAHFAVLLAAIQAGRTEMLRLHRSGRIHDETLHALERDLDLVEMANAQMVGEEV